MDAAPERLYLGTDDEPAQLGDVAAFLADAPRRPCSPAGRPRAGSRQAAVQRAAAVGGLGADVPVVPRGLRRGRVALEIPRSGRWTGRAGGADCRHGRHALGSTAGDPRRPPPPGPRPSWSPSSRPCRTASGWCCPTTPTASTCARPARRSTPTTWARCGPTTPRLGGVVAFIAIVGVPTAPFISGGVAMWSLFTVWSWWRTLTVLEVVLYAAAAWSGSRRSPGWPRRWRTSSSCGSGTDLVARLYPNREGRRNPPYGVSRRSLVPCRRPDLPCTDLSIARLAGHN